MPKRPNWRAASIHKSYHIDEAARTLGIAKGTVARWVKSGDLPAVKDRRPYLILGRDLVDLGKQRKCKSAKCQVHQCYCFKCRAIREPAGRMADFWPVTAKVGHIQALCGVCGRVMNKRVGIKQADVLKAILDLTLRNASPHIG